MLTPEEIKKLADDDIKRFRKNIKKEKGNDKLKR